MTKTQSRSLDGHEPLNKTAAYALERADEHGVELEDFTPESVDDLDEGMVLATHRESRNAELVEVVEIFEKDGRQYVRADYPEREHTPVTWAEHLVESFIDKIEADGGWVLVPYTARTPDATPYNCPTCNRFAVIHEGITEPFVHGGCDSCGQTFHHNHLVQDGVAVELLL